MKICSLCPFKTCSDRGYLNHIKRSHHGKDVAKLQGVSNGGHVEIENKFKKEELPSILQEVKNCSNENEMKIETTAKEPDEEKFEEIEGKKINVPYWECTKKFSRCFGQSFLSEESLKKHFQQCHQNYKCDVCGYPFKKFSNLNEHMKRFHNATSYKCDICQQYFNFRLDLISHYDNQHEKMKTYKCHR